MLPHAQRVHKVKASLRYVLIAHGVLSQVETAVAIIISICCLRIIIRYFLENCEILLRRILRLIRRYYQRSVLLILDFLLRTSKHAEFSWGRQLTQAVR